MPGLYDRDYTKLTNEEITERENIDFQSKGKQKFGMKNPYFEYSKAVRHNKSLFPNNFIDLPILQDTEELGRQCDAFEELLNDKSITELNVKRYIQDNGFYHIPASIFANYHFAHHEAVLFKEFPLGTSYRADYLLAGRASGGWQFIFVEFENPYGSITLQNGDFGATIRNGLSQIDMWKAFIEGYYSALTSEFEKYAARPLDTEFTKFDSTRMHYVVVAGRRSDYKDRTRRLQRLKEKNENIKVLHYDNILDNARRLIEAQSY